MQSKLDLKIVEDKLADKCAEANFIKIKEELKDINCDEGGFNQGKFRKLKKETMSKTSRSNYSYA